MSVFVEARAKLHRHHILVDERIRRITFCLELARDDVWNRTGFEVYDGYRGRPESEGGAHEK